MTRNLRDVDVGTEAGGYLDAYVITMIKILGDGYIRMGILLVSMFDYEYIRLRDNHPCPRTQTHGRPWLHDTGRYRFFPSFGMSHATATSCGAPHCESTTHGIEGRVSWLHCQAAGGYHNERMSILE